jgi:hypothetical protein
MNIHVGSVQINIQFNNIIGFDDEYFIPRFEKVLVKGEITEWTMMGTAFDCSLILQYDCVEDLKFLQLDIQALQKVLNRNKKRLLPRSDENERKVMGATCVIGSICDNWVFGKGKENAAT